MNRRDFVKALGSAAVMATAPAVVMAEVLKEPEIISYTYTTSWIPVGIKPWTVVFYRGSNDSPWEIFSTEKNPCAGVLHVYRESGEQYFHTGFDPHTGCFDDIPKKITNES